MPGIMTSYQLETEIDLDRIKLKIRGQLAESADLVSWDTSSINDPNSIKGIISELASAVGPILSAEMCVTFD